MKKIFSYPQMNKILKNETKLTGKKFKTLNEICKSFNKGKYKNEKDFKSYFYC